MSGAMKAEPETNYRAMGSKLAIFGAFLVVACAGFFSLFYAASFAELLRLQANSGNRIMLMPYFIFFLGIFITLYAFVNAPRKKSGDKNA